MWREIVSYNFIIFFVCQICVAEEKGGFVTADFPNGMKIYQPDKCWNGYTMVPYENGLILIVDMKGNVVHHWEIGTERARLLENGHVVVMKGSRIVEYDWDGKLVWEYEVPGDPFADTGYPSPGIIHHDLQRLSNGNTIFIIHEAVPDQDKSVIQGTQQRLRNGNTFICESTSGRLFEVTDKGEVVWEYVMPSFPGSDEEHGGGTRPQRYGYDYCPQFKTLPKPKL